MKYYKICEIYKRLSSTKKRLEKIEILCDFFKDIEEKNSRVIYLLLGKFLPDYDQRDLGVSEQILIKALSHSFSLDSSLILKKFKEIGDLGDVAENLLKEKKQVSLFSKELTTEKIFENFEKMLTFEGKGTIDKKISLISELLLIAKKEEIKYLVRTILSNLRIGLSTQTILEAFSKYFFNGENKELIEEKYNLSNDISEIFNACKKGIKELDKINIKPGVPINVMLAIKVFSIKEAFEYCGRPAAVEQKYDGFRMLISKKENGDFYLFTRKLENVTNQFPEIVELVKKNVKAKSFILDSEVVGFNKKTKKYLPFEAISQRIKRKYEINKMVEELPVEVNVFDCLYFNGKGLLKRPFFERRKILEKIIKEEKMKIRPAIQIITDNEEEAERFFKKSIEEGNEGIMIKNLNAEYKQGRRVGYMCKFKPESKEFDLVILKAEYGEGKRSGLLTSYTLACRDGDDLLEVGKVSSGLKEKEEEGLSYEKMTKLLEPLIIKEVGKEVEVKPYVVVTVSYQNIQESPSYSSGLALRFPKIVAYRPDRSWKDIASLEEIKKDLKTFKFN
ncbi:MAG: ATP-dependent DNA ligase [Candidatus Pacearchaeota archaeon]